MSFLQNDKNLFVAMLISQIILPCGIIHHALGTWKAKLLTPTEKNEKLKF